MKKREFNQQDYSSKLFTDNIITKHTLNSDCTYTLLHGTNLYKP